MYQMYALLCVSVRQLNRVIFKGNIGKTLIWYIEDNHFEGNHFEDVDKFE